MRVLRFPRDHPRLQNRPLDVVSVTPSTDSAAVVSPDAPPPPISPLKRGGDTVTFSRAVALSSIWARRAAATSRLSPRPAGRRPPAVGDHLDYAVRPGGRSPNSSDAPQPVAHDVRRAKFATSSQQWQFITPSCVSSARVRSEAALRLTNGTWSSTAHRSPRRARCRRRADRAVVLGGRRAAAAAGGPETPHHRRGARPRPARRDAEPTTPTQQPPPLRPSATRR